MARTKNGVVLGAAISAIVSSCTPAQMNGVSPALLVINSIEAGSGAREDELSNTLQSDVVTRGVVLEDVGRVTLTLALKDPGSLDSPAQPSTSNSITVTRYRVVFVRSDGRNTPGVDVPYPFDGAMTVTVGDAGVTGRFALVRAHAKLEAPLMALRQRGGAIAISTLAEVTFYGHDQAGHSVSAVGQISVNFGDWADPE